jgi:DNA-binding MarR family transcriptional regulator
MVKNRQITFITRLHIRFGKWGGKEADMRLIDDLARGFPGLDLQAIRILLQIHATPGFCIRELAEILGMDQKTAQLKIALLGTGRKNRSGAAYGLVDEDRNPADHRRRSLSTTPAGAAVAEQLMILTAAMPQ